jgi:hypothetical protein
LCQRLLQLVGGIMGVMGYVTLLGIFSEAEIWILTRPR